MMDVTAKTVPATQRIPAAIRKRVKECIDCLAFVTASAKEANSRVYGSKDEAGIILIRF
jgi:hypothetical protein